MHKNKSMSEAIRDGFSVEFKYHQLEDQGQKNCQALG